MLFDFSRPKTLSSPFIDLLAALCCRLADSRRCSRSWLGDTVCHSSRAQIWREGEKSPSGELELRRLFLGVPIDLWIGIILLENIGPTSFQLDTMAQSTKKLSLLFEQL